MRRKRRASKFRMFAIAVSSATLLGCGGDENTYEAPPPPAVTVIKPPVREFRPFRDIVATIRPEEVVEIRARVDGFLETRQFEPGETVSAGQVLFTLETAEYQAAVDGGLADLAAAKAKLQLDTELRDKYQTAFDQGAASDSELLEARARVEVSAASVQQAEAKLARTRLDLSYTTISSPIDGRIGEDLVSVGNLVGRGEPTLLAKVSSIDPMNVYFDVPETTYLEFRTALAAAGEDPDARGDYPFELVLPDGTVLDTPGNIDFIDTEIDRTTGTMRLRGSIANPDGLLRDGLFVRARIRQPARDALALPASAVLVDMAGEYVYLVGDDGLVSRQGVETGASLDGLTEIVRGVDGQDIVIVDGILRTRPGARVTAETVDLREAMRRLDPASPAAGMDD